MNDCNDAQCKQVHYLLDALLERLQLPPMECIVSVGKAVTVGDAIGALQSELAALRRRDSTCDAHRWPYGAEDTTGPRCVWCEMLEAEKLRAELAENAAARKMYSDANKQLHSELSAMRIELAALKTPHACKDCEHYDSSDMTCYSQQCMANTVKAGKPMWLCGHFKAKGETK